MSTFIAIGNSDNRLTQQEWAEYVDVVAHLVISDDFVSEVHFAGFSPPHSAYQTGMWCVVVRENQRYRLRALLKAAAAEFKQDSIAWTDGKTEFLRALPTRAAQQEERTNG